MKYFNLLHFAVVSSLFSIAQTFEPITTSILIAASAAGGYKYYEQIKQNTYCRRWECCLDSNVPFDILRLKESLKTKLFGQHIVEEKVFQAIASHYKEIENSQKPLVMTFHGLPGTGKNFVSNLIAESVFEKGLKSQFYHVFHGSQYEDAYRANFYKEQIKEEVFAAIDKCPYSIFVFDEVDKMPIGIFESITAILDHHTLVRGKDFKKSIFIFLTNYGGEEITKVLYQLTSKKGLYRHETKLHHFEEIIKVGVWNRDGGLKESSLIKSAVIDFYLPFLPLEEKHVIDCIKSEYAEFSRSEVTKEMIDDILNYVGFQAVTKYCKTGCKSIRPKVRAECL